MGGALVHTDSDLMINDTLDNCRRVLSRLPDLGYFVDEAPCVSDKFDAARPVLR